MDDARVFLTSGGGDSIDTAAKLVRRHFVVNGQRERTHIIARTQGYHGTHGFGTSLGGIEANTTNWGPLVPAVSTVPYDSLPALEAEIERVGPDKVAAFFCEPVIGAGGVYAPPEGYLEGVREVCRDAGVLFVADEVITGFGRVGSWFASARWNLEPDLMTTAKGITSGYLPMGAVIAAPWIAEPFYDGTAGLWRHGYTYSGHATAAAAALANLDILEREALTDRAKALETELADALAPLEQHDLISEVRRGVGVLAAVQLDPDAIASDATLPARLVAACREHGVLTRALGTGALQISPALILNASETTELVEGISTALATLG
jgi:adenosylmethionine-8-amino-7-oxononanoate aminotransferase